ncbi:insulinase family protein [Patescibacteria group bacterium]|nr:insulinase family protein [Patescibacteria group bacterium]MBU1922441.1 insulinase family protein [Patescibacteria group bacterium]
MRCLQIPVAGTKAVTVLVLCKVGSRHENRKINGASHFIEHLMFKGTAKRPTTLDISREFDSVGAEYNAATSKDWTGYFAKVSRRHLDLALDLLSDMIWNSKFDEQEFTREKGVITEEIHMYEDNPMSHVENLLEEVMYPANTLGWNIAGTAKIIKNLKHGDLVRFHEEFYEPDNMLVAVAGSLPTKTNVLAQKYFGARPAKTKRPSPGFEKFKGFTSHPKPRCNIQYKKTEQVNLALGFPGLAYEAEGLPALQVLNVIIGATMSSRLFIAVREREGLAYYVRSAVESYEDTGIFEIRAGLDMTRFGKAVEIIKFELGQMVKHGPTREEMARAKEFIRGKLELSLEDSAQQAEFYARQMLLMKKIKTPEQRLGEVLRVRRADVLRAARKCFNFKRMGLAAIGPFRDKNQIIKYF